MSKEAKKDPMAPQRTIDTAKKMTLSEFMGHPPIKNGFGINREPKDPKEQFGGKMPPFSRAELKKRGLIK
jgi:hypothetical protein